MARYLLCTLAMAAFCHAMQYEYFTDGDRLASQEQELEHAVHLLHKMGYKVHIRRTVEEERPRTYGLTPLQLLRYTG